MQMRTLTLASTALSASFLISACDKTPAPAPGTQPTSGQPASVSAPVGTPATTPVAPATTPSDARVAPGTVATAPTAPASGGVATTPAAAPTPAPTFVVPAGTRVSARTNQSLSGEHDDVGTSFTGELSSPVVVRGSTVFPRGTQVRGEITSAKGRGRFKGAGYLGITLTSIGGYRIQTSEYSVRAKGRGKRTGTFIGGGAGLGALIGGIAGGGKGAVIGGLSGAGAGTAVGATTGSRDVVIPAESAVSFTTQSSISVKR